MQLICPLCHQPLSRSEQRWHCANRHSFDIAKQGYCNLLPVQHKKSLHPGDDSEMVAARRRFLTGGYYQPIATAINQIVQQYLADQQLVQPAIIDAGCGEGYYSSMLAQCLTKQAIDWQMVGLDISKHAALAAAKRDKAIQWLVANSSAIPVDNHSVDILLSLFSPLPCEEFYRCLKPGGLLLVASTGSQHLIELRQRVYEQVNEQSFDPAGALAGHFSALPLQHIQHTLQLDDNATIKDLFAMTPHYWRVAPDKKAVLDKVQQLSLSLDIQLHSFMARPMVPSC